MPERTDQPPEQPTPAPDGGTPANDQAAALHWAAVAFGLAEARTRQGNPLTETERVEYDRYLDAARAHGFTDEQIHAHVPTWPSPAVTR